MMSQFAFFLLLLTLSFFGGEANTNGSTLMPTEQTVMKSTLDSHPSILQAKELATASAGKLRSAKGLFDPSLGYTSEKTEGYYENQFQNAYIKQMTPLWGLSLQAGLQQSEGNFPVYEGKRITSDEGAAYLKMELPLLRGGPTDDARTEIKAAEIGQQIAEIQTDEKANEVLAKARTSYWKWVLTSEKREIAKRLLQIAVERDAALSKQASKGSIPKFDVLDNKRLIYQRQAQVALAERNLFVAAQDLSLYFRDSNGRPQTPTIADTETLAQKFPSPESLRFDDSQTLVKRALEMRPEVLVLKRLIDQKSVEISLAKNQILPEVTLSYERTSEGSPRVDQGGFTGENRLGLNFSVPLLQMKARGQTLQLEAEKKSFEYRLRIFNETLSAQIEALTRSIQLSKDVLVNATETFKLAEQVENGERTRYKSGQSDLIKINIRETDTAAAALMRLDSHFEILVKAVELEQTIGVQKAFD